MAWNDTNEFPHQWFWWQGLDGSQILAHCSSEIGQAIEPEAIATFMSEQEDRNDLQEGLWFFGVGDHGGGPTPRHLAGRRDGSAVVRRGRPEAGPVRRLRARRKRRSRPLEPKPLGRPRWPESHLLLLTSGRSARTQIVTSPRTRTTPP
ncbi:MAG: hypothetical protein AAFU68_17345 [Pseudomonadota bacterium]